MNRTEIIKNFLLGRTHFDLAGMYSHDMEVQVNVAQDGGERVEASFEGRKWNGWTDGIETWKSFRIPYKANSEPEYTDKPLNFDFEKHVEAIGMTGWNWRHRRSEWVAYDFDAIVGHSQKHEKKLTPEELKTIEKAVAEVPWVELRKSTGGLGLHVYVYLTGIETANHHEHQALARAILGLLSANTGVNFQTKVDVCGGNMWIWHRKIQNQGLSIIKKCKTKLGEVPANWRDHLEVIKGSRKRTTPSFIEEEDVFEELTGKNNHVKLDKEHQKLIDFLTESGAAWWWDSDHHMLVAHTYDLKQAHTELGFKGLFTTLATGREHGADHNCFAYPMPRGAWSVRRYTPNTAETDIWETDNSNWTMCYYNREPSLKVVARTRGAVEDTDGSFVFQEAEVAQRAAEVLGIAVDLPTYMCNRPTRFKEDKFGRLIVEIEKNKLDKPQDMTNWLDKKNKHWQRIYDTKLHVTSNIDAYNYDNEIRHLVTTSDEDCGWMMRTEGTWRAEPLNHVRVYLESTGLKVPEVKSVLGNCIAKPWRIVNKPFDDEYPGDRCWNKNSARFNFALLTEESDHPTWQNILDHVGESLNESVKTNEWACENNILTGSDYLRCWIASLFKEPEEPLPYLFLFGPQNSGKSILHESLELLVTGGVERADNAITSQSGFNAEIAHAILCVIEEIDLRKNNQAYHRIKDWVTSRKIPIHQKGQTPYSIVNTTHWIQCANELEALRIFPGDSRITVLFVDHLKKIIPKKQLIPQLEKEAPAFLTSVMNLELPYSHDRLNVPVIETQQKFDAQQANRSPLQEFVDEKCYKVDGEWIRFSEFYDFFKGAVEPEIIAMYSKIKTSRELQSLGILKGRSTKDSQHYLGNISWQDKEPTNPRYILHGETLIQGK